MHVGKPLRHDSAGQLWSNYRIADGAGLGGVASGITAVLYLSPEFQLNRRVVVDGRLIWKT